MQRLPAITHDRFSLFRFRSPLLTESRLLSLPVGTEMFHGNPRITVWLSTPRGLSQIPTSFFGSWCQGIHRAPLKTWPQRCSRPLCSSQNTGGTPPHTGADHIQRHDQYDQQARPELKSRAYARAFRTQQRAKHHPPDAPLSIDPPEEGTSTHNRHHMRSTK